MAVRLLQGLDARLFDSKKAKLLAKLALNPCRIAFDDIKCKTEYVSAMKKAMRAGIKYFSNYLLYNYNDKPVDLWKRLAINVQFYKEHDERVTLFSFPMKYASIELTDRDYVGVHWHRNTLEQ